MSATVTVTTRPCIQCNQTSEITVDQEAFFRWQAGAFVQVAFPDMTADQRELLISGTHPACWDAMFPEDED